MEKTRITESSSLQAVSTWCYEPKHDPNYFLAVAVCSGYKGSVQDRPHVNDEHPPLQLVEKNISSILLKY
jgi:hypothetical protein